MATISGGQASVIAGGTSSFGQFRLTTFVDSTPKSSRTTAPSPVPGTARSDDIAQPVSQRGENGSTMSSSHGLAAFSNTMQQSPQTFARTPPSLPVTTGQSNAPAPNSHNGFGVLDLAAPPVREGKLGPHRDGRVRNPVPLKLKGRTDEKNGEFSVMHMDMSGNDTPRSEAAQRTSESTAQAAKAASNESYKSIKRRRLEGSTSVQMTQDQQITQPPPSFPAVPAVPTVPAVPPQEPLHRTRVLTSEETKYEQARLLTLLRSINPLTVVDQICKALAFFGGIPGAPPPENGGFPESADANGSGKLFVGWLSEIFPELERKAWRPEVLQPREVNRGPRPRGRPKGSKASKVRKDKGIKKGPKNPNKLIALGLKAPDVPVDDPDEEWIDVTEMDPQPDKDELSGAEGNGTLPKTRPQRSLPGHMSSVNVDLLDFTQDDSMEHQSFEIPSQEFPSSITNTGKRRPGRPKGSRNRQRDLLDGSSSEVQGILPTPESQRHQPRPSSVGVTNKSNTSQVADQSMTSTPMRKVTSGTTQQSPQVSAKRRQGQLSTDVESVSLVPPQVPGLSAEEQAMIEAFRISQNVQATNKPAAANDKAKRTRPKSGVRPADEASSAISSILHTNTTNTAPVASGKATTQGATTTQPAYKDSGPILPPPKRQRKTKESNTTTAKKSSQVTDTSNSASAPSSMVKSTTSSSDSAGISNVRPPAQGLEAHYERFANLQHQGDQQQQQYQQTRHDLNVGTRSSPMQSASAYYQQPRHVPSPYDQQYTSHQTANPYQPALLNQSDSFRAGNQQHTTFPSQQQQASHQFSQFPNSSFIDIPTLDSVANGTANVGTYGQSISRSASNASFGTGAQMGHGFDSLSDNDIRERLLRGIGRR